MTWAWSLAEHGLFPRLLVTATGSLLLIFALWWSYFKWSPTEALRLSPRSGFIWGYSHFAVFAATAAVGAGLQVVTGALRDGEGMSLPPAGAALTVAVPVALYQVVLGLLHRHLEGQQPVSAAPTIGTAVVLLALAGAAAFVDLSLVVLLMGGLVAWQVATLQRQERGVAA